MSFRSFGSFEEMQAWMQQQEDTANLRVTDEQRSINPGDYVVRPHPIDGLPMLIVGKTYSLAEFLVGEAEAGAEADELESQAVEFLDRVKRGYLFGRWYSVIEPAGEYGDAHISTLWPTTEEHYQQYLEKIQQGIDPSSWWGFHLLIDKE